MKLRGDFESLRQRITGLEQENRSLSADLDKYSAGDYSDRDILASGYVSSGGKIVKFTGNPDGSSTEKKKQGVMNRFEFELSHLRIIWIIFSVVFAVYYFKKRNSRMDEYNG